ncbi:S1 RNA-binding domain-containing protein [Crassaminicella thermophila]|uniref:S1 RNA-binding domain-containing protein n=1 Tax=Crassaminicella thermophila TaxID=2599308 RepID=A0A5C0SHG6_CRATE|nr:S1-like domain-containing RNA-binding protein [Crassaminicella thermophila]QEK12864.1 S1 RNA-binding domain-containing protein [Crassaminicella thermophila]
MIEVGKFNKLKVANIVQIGAYLDAMTDNPNDNILLPNNQLPDNIKVGDILDVFIYRDSKDRLIATRKKPFAQVGELAYLKVVQTTKIGAFLDWGLEKDLFLPFGEQKYKVQSGRSYLVYIYVDKSNRLSATTDVEKYLKTDSPYKQGDRVKGTVYKIKKDIGAFVAVDNKYIGLIPKNEYFHDIRNGDEIEVRITKVREDGKLNLSTRKAAYKQMATDADIILEKIKEEGGFLKLHDKSAPEQIKYHLKMSKSAFKRAVGRLLKENKVEQTEDGLKLK